MPGGCRTPPLNPDMIAPTCVRPVDIVRPMGHMMDAAVVLACPLALRRRRRRPRTGPAFYGQLFSQA